jgi:hypothetical protein
MVLSHIFSFFHPCFRKLADNLFESPCVVHEIQKKGSDGQNKKGNSTRQLVL